MLHHINRIIINVNKVWFNTGIIFAYFVGIYFKKEVCIFYLGKAVINIANDISEKL